MPSPIAERLRQERLSRDMTLAVVAQRAGLHISALAMYEAGEREPTITRATFWAEALGMKLELREGS